MQNSNEVKEMIKSVLGENQRANLSSETAKNHIAGEILNRVGGEDRIGISNDSMYDYSDLTLRIYEDGIVHCREDDVHGCNAKDLDNFLKSELREAIVKRLKLLGVGGNI